MPSSDRPARYQSAPEFWRDPAEAHRKVTQVLNDAQRGRTNAHFVLTLDADADFTDLVTDLATIQTVAVLSPRTTAACQETPYYEAFDGFVRIHHDNSPVADRTYGIALYG